MITDRLRAHLTASLSILLLLLTACSSIDCPVQNTVYTVYTLHKSDLSTDTLNGDTLTVYSRRHNGSDTLLLNQITAVTQFTLPMGYSNPEDTLYFYLKVADGETTDTVWIKKENQPHFESVDCSAAFFHHITAVRHTRNGIDSIAINKSTVNYDGNTEHFHLYLKARR